MRLRQRDLATIICPLWIIIGNTSDGFMSALAYATAGAIAVVGWAVER
jgi:hypothetical protein